VGLLCPHIVIKNENLVDFKSTTTYILCVYVVYILVEKSEILDWSVDMSNSTTINVRMDSTTKTKVAHILNLLGITPSEAINLYFKQIIYTQGIPFEVKLPNAATLHAMKELDSGKGVKFDNVEDLLKDLKS
jgi:DNA-damage-inducible protein J